MDYTVTVKIPMYVTKEIYVDDATSKTDARKKARMHIKGNVNMYDESGDSDTEYNARKATILEVKEDK
jgi:phage gp45-like|tara:strand:- start:817 stop:1020 length:204 start_codon:yes stop_codon:yes gene_type:complete